MIYFSNGTWQLNDDNGFIIAGDERIAQVFGATVHNHEDNREKCFAYARLIAHAPEMFRLLHDVLYNVDFYEDSLQDLEGDILMLIKDIRGREI